VVAGVPPALAGPASPRERQRAGGKDQPRNLGRARRSAARSPAARRRRRRAPRVRAGLLGSPTHVPAWQVSLRWPGRRRRRRCPRPWPRRRTRPSAGRTGRLVALLRRRAEPRRLVPLQLSPTQTSSRVQGSCRRRRCRRPSGSRGRRSWGCPCTGRRRTGVDGGRRRRRRRERRRGWARRCMAGGGIAGAGGVAGVGGAGAGAGRARAGAVEAHVAEVQEFVSSQGVPLGRIP
jgi:hypothetical protein